MTVQPSPTRPPRADAAFPPWKRTLAGVGWDALFIVTVLGLIVVGLVIGVALAAILATVSSPLHLTGALGVAVGLIVLAGFLVPLFALPILGVRRLRRALPPDLFPEPASSARPLRRSTSAILADVARLDAALARTTPPPPDRYDDTAAAPDERPGSAGS